MNNSRNHSLFHLPECWPTLVRRTMLHVCSLAHWAIIYTRSMCADSKLQRVRLSGELDKARNEISLLQEELRIIKTRFAKIPAKHRPYYPPTERMAILELKAMRGWNLTQTAQHFMVEKETIAEWIKRIEDNSLIRIPVPVNKFPEFVRYVVRRLKTLCPLMGKKQVAEFLTRAGLYLSASTVGRFTKTSAKPDPDNLRTEPYTKRVITARHPNHVWHADLTVVPTGKGFWTSWFPYALPQIWPFCYWVAIVLDHFSRKVIGFAVFNQAPSSLEARSFLGRTMGRNRCKPKYIICDRSKQFDCNAFRKWCKHKKIKPRYGAVGKYGSIAIIERFIRTMKDECTQQILVPLNFNDMRQELALYLTWYNEFRPHQALNGRTPQEVYTNTSANAPPVLSEVEGPFGDLPNSQLPEMKLLMSYLAGRRHLPVVELKLAA